MIPAAYTSCAKVTLLLNEGARLGSYHIEARLGSGGMGEVYRARDLQLDRQVAIKVLRQDTDRTALWREARAAAALNHPNICTIHEISDVDGVTFIVMELVDGRPLSDSDEAHPGQAVVAMAIQVADALSHAHTRGVIHRDLKRANLMVSPDRRIKILDFGIARRVDPADVNDGTTSLESTPVICGTPAYMAPEVLRGMPADPRSDIWSLGVVLFELAAGRPPFDGSNVIDLSSSILRDAPADLPPHVDAPLRSVILKCLAKSPDDRFQHAADVKRALESSASLSAETTASAIRAIAILPLENLSGDPEQEFFVDGMTDALTAALAMSRAARVISRNSAMRFKGTREPLAAVARALGVDALVLGSVQRSGDLIRLTAQLVAASSDSVIWAQAHEVPIADVLKMQSAIAREMAVAIGGGLQPPAAHAPAPPTPTRPEAYLEYLRGRFHWRRLTIEGVRKALEHFQAALTLDPAYALAHAGLATCHSGLAWTGAAPPKVSFARSKAAALQALALNQSIAEAHMNLGYIAMNEWQWAAAERYLRRAIELDPASADASLFLCFYLTSMGRHDEAIATLLHAQELDPLSPLVSSNLGYQSYFARRFESAHRHCAATFEIDPTFEMAHWVSGVVQTGLGDYDAAVVELERAAEASAGFVVLGWLGYAYARAGQLVAARSVLQRLQAVGPEWTARLPEIVRVQVGLQEYEGAIATLEEAVAINAMGLQYLNVDASMDPIRTDPRFKSALVRMGLRHE